MTTVRALWESGRTDILELNPLRSQPGFPLPKRVFLGPFTFCLVWPEGRVYMEVPKREHT